MYGLEATFNTLRQMIGWDAIPLLATPAECAAGDPRCWAAVHDQSGVVRPFDGRPGPRDPTTVPAIEVHQFGCELGVSRLQLKNAGGDPRLALRHRVLKQPYHVVGMLNGDVIRNHPVTRYTFHGNGGNSFTLGVGIEGNYPGRERSRTAKHTALERAVMVGRAALAEAEKMLREGGVTGPIKVHAHRNFSSERAADPGEGLWREVVAWGAEQLGLVTDLELRQGSGLPIPVEWDAASGFNWTGARRGQ